MHIVMIVLQAKKMARKWSIIWVFFFSEQRYQVRYLYHLSGRSFKGWRGSTKSYTTTNLVNHLAKHPDVNKQYSSESLLKKLQL